MREDAGVARDGGGVDARTTDGGLVADGCRATRGPTVLYEDPEFRPGALVVVGGALFFGAVASEPGLPEPPRGALFRVPTVGGASERVPTDAVFFSGEFAIDDGWLVFHHAEISGGAGGWTAAYPDLVVRDRAAGDEARHPDGGDRWAGTSAFALSDAGRVFYVDRREEPYSLKTVRAGEPPQTLRREDIRQLVVHDGTLFSHTYDRSGNVVRAATIADDGTLGEPVELAATGAPACCGILGVDEARLYYYREGARRVEAVPRTGGEPDVVAEDARVQLATAALGREHLYWGDSAAVMFVPITGGRPEVLFDGGTSYVQRVAVDDRCVYWSVVNPPRILAAPIP